jgi:hypothetical protein
MPRTTRSRNLDLIRWLNFGHENTAKKILSLTNANYLSKMATGDMDISDQMARDIESELDMPMGWLDRDNIDVIGMDKLEYEAWQAMKSLSNESKSAMLAFLRTLK